MRTSQWQAVAMSFLLCGVPFGVWASRIPAFKDRFELDPGLLGLLLLGLAGGAIIAFPLAGALSERLGAARLSLICSVIYLVTLLTLALSPTIPAFAIALIAFGALHGSLDIGMNGWAAKVETQSGRSIMSVFHAIFSLGAGLGAGSGYVAARFAISIEVHFATIVTVFALIAIPIIWRGQSSASSQRHQRAPESTKTPLFALPKGALLGVGLIGFCISVGEGAMADWSAVFIRLTLAASDSHAALGYAIFSLMMVLTRLCGGIIVEKLGPVKTLQASAATAFLGVALAILAGEISVMLAGFALMGIGYATAMPIVFSRAANDPNIPPGAALASVATLAYGGMLLGPPIIGFLAQLFGIRLSFLSLLALAALAFFLARFLRQKAD